MVMPLLCPFLYEYFETGSESYVLHTDLVYLWLNPICPSPFSLLPGGWVVSDTTTLLQVMGLGTLDWSCSLNIFLLKFIWISGYSDKGGCVWCMPIPVLSRDGQSISGSWDTLTRGFVCSVTHPSTIPGWSEYLWILGYSDKGGCVWCMSIPVLDGQSISGSGILWQGVLCVVLLIPVQSRDGQCISGSRDTLTRGLCVVCTHPGTIPSISGSWDSLPGVDVWYVWSSHYCHEMARVSLDIPRDPLKV